MGLLPENCQNWEFWNTFTLIFYRLARWSESKFTCRLSDRLYQLWTRNYSYRKQIARQLRAQYVEGIYDNPLTLKSRLSVTQNHWKRNHWVDRTRLTIRRETICDFLLVGHCKYSSILYHYWRWIISWPWNRSYRSLNVSETGAIRKLGCGFLFAFYSNCGRICSRLWDIQCQRMVWLCKPG